jgi:hypothetical protein
MDASTLQVLLGIAIFAMLFSIGIGLAIADFKRVIAQPKAFTITLACQLLLPTGRPAFSASKHRVRGSWRIWFSRSASASAAALSARAC